MKNIFLISGLSESGKSTFGRYLDSKGIRRLKFVNYLKEIQHDESDSRNFHEWNDLMETQRPEWLYSRFAEKFESDLTRNKLEHCCVESLYKPAFGLYLKKRFGEDKVTIIYINTPLPTRLKNQIHREDLSSMREAERLIGPRDLKKESWGVGEMKEIADEIIENTGSRNQLYRSADILIEKYVPELLKK